MPIAPKAPTVSFMWMSPFGPLLELVVHLPIEAVKDTFGDRSAKVPRPPTNDWVKGGDECCLVCTAILVDDLLDTHQVSLLRVFAGFDERFETWLAVKGAGTILTNVVLTDVEAKKVKPDLALMCVERMRNARLPGLEFESHLSQPGFGTVFELQEYLEVITENDEIIGIANDCGGMLSGRRSCDGLFKTVQGDVRQQR